MMEQPELTLLAILHTPLALDAVAEAILRQSLSCEWLEDGQYTLTIDDDVLLLEGQKRKLLHGTISHISQIDTLISALESSEIGYSIDVFEEDGRMVKRCEGGAS